MSDGDQKPGTRQPPAKRSPARSRRQPVMLLARAGHLEYDRILFFSDAVFAIAITLLIVDLPVQVERMSGSSHPAAISSHAELHDAIPGIEGFGISFVVIGLFWTGHHGLFRFITAFDRPLMMANLLFLGAIAFLPFPTALLSSVSSNQETAVIFYAVCAGSAGLLETAIWLYATHRDGLVAGIGPETQRLFLLRTARIPAVFAVSIAVAALGAPRAATYTWLGMIVTGIAINRIYGHHDPGDTGDANRADAGAADPAAAA